LAGIYIHIPFCKKACHYCNFHFSTSLKLKNDLIGALLKEIELKSGKNEELIETVYLGGGTPSLLDNTDINVIFDALYRNFRVSPEAEVTLEANPDDITMDKSQGWRKIGINRLSIGIQSFDDKDLAWMNRAHSADQAYNSISIIRDAGFSNYSIDLIFGTPLLTDEEWEKNVERAIELRVPHISSYALTVEPKTALHKMIEQKKSAEVDAEKQAAQYLQLMQWLEDAGYEHYEISSFAKAGMRSRHNSSYWQGKKYFGFGPSAHSFDETSRSWNVANNTAYIQSLQKGVIPAEIENLTAIQHLNEYIMTSLRTVEGLDILRVKDKWGDKTALEIENRIRRFEETQKVIKTENNFQLTREGKLFADGIAADLFFTE
jgi:oxygen-independent coproporphyrinogen-3 oxidase